jgi:ribosome biogenesis GTPase A
MLIHWYPGHMHKAQREIREIIHKIDVFIEVLDARLPDSSTNPLLEEIREGKPCLKVLSKADLADPDITQAWQRALEKIEGVKTLAITTQQPGIAKQIPDIVKSMVPHRGMPGKPVRSMIMGIPNVGKSTLINTLLGRKIAKVGNEPAVTKRQQKILIDPGFQLMDTPGIMSPSPKSELAGYRLAASGAIRDTAMEYEDVALFAMDYLLQRYPLLLKERFQLDTLPDTAYQCMEKIAPKRGCVRKGGIDIHRLSEILLKDLRDGTLGRLSLEEPGIVYPYRDLLIENLQ